MTRGVYFALTADERQAIESQTEDAARIDALQDVERRWDEAHLQETDKAWDAIHACLTECSYEDFEDDEAIFQADHGTYPLKLCVLGGKRLLSDDEWYVMRLIEPAEVVDIARALDGIEHDWMHAQYRRCCLGEEPDAETEDEEGDDFGYVWGWFEDVRDFFKRMAGNGRCVVFSFSR